MGQSCCHLSAVLGPAALCPLPSPPPGPRGDATAPQLWAPHLGGQRCGRLAKGYRAHPWVTKQTTFPLGAAVPSCRLGHPLAAWQDRPDFNILLNDGHWIHLRTVLRGKQLSMEGRAQALHVGHSQMGPKAARPPPCPPHPAPLLQLPGFRQGRGLPSSSGRLLCLPLSLPWTAPPGLCPSPAGSHAPPSGPRRSLAEARHLPLPALLSDPCPLSLALFLSGRGLLSP